MINKVQIEFHIVCFLSYYLHKMGLLGKMAVVGIFLEFSETVPFKELRFFTLHSVHQGVSFKELKQGGSTNKGATPSRFHFKTNANLTKFSSFLIK